MNERDFIYWLNGFLELSNATELNAEQVAMLRQHIRLVMYQHTRSVIPAAPGVLNQTQHAASCAGKATTVDRRDSMHTRHPEGMGGQLITTENRILSC